MQHSTLHSSHVQRSSNTAAALVGCSNARQCQRRAITSCRAAATRHYSSILLHTQQQQPRRGALQLARSIVSKDNLPPEFSEAAGYALRFVVFSRLTPKTTTADLQPHLPQHEAWLKGLGDRLVLHGPFLNAEASYYGSEMFAVRADSAAEARQLVEQDPLHAQGLRKFELMAWVQSTQW